MGRGKQQAPTTDAEQQAPLPKGAVVDARTGKVFVPADHVSSDPEVEQSTDTVAEVLAGNYSEGIVNEVRSYEKPRWDQEPSSLDPVDDIDTFVEYDLRLPPDAYDAYSAAAKMQLDELEEMKAPPEASTAAKIAARQELVKGKSADDIRWLKHKAYYRGLQRIRAGKAADAAAAEAEATPAQQPDATPQQQQQQPAAPQQQQQQQQRRQQRYVHLSEDEVLAGVSDPSEWDMSWTGADYSTHPQVLHQLRTVWSEGAGLPPYRTAAQAADAEEQNWQQLKAAAAAADVAAADGAAAQEALLGQYLPYQAYTPHYLAEQRRQKVLSSHRRTKQQAFWLSLGLALGSSAYRWWRTRGSNKPSRRRSTAAGGQQQQGGTGGGGSSRRSTRPPTPSALQLHGSIAE